MEEEVFKKTLVTCEFVNWQTNITIYVNKIIYHNFHHSVVSLVAKVWFATCCTNYDKSSSSSSSSIIHGKSVYISTSGISATERIATTTCEYFCLNAKISVERPELIFFTDITVYICGEKIVIWQNFSFLYRIWTIYWVLSKFMPFLFQNYVEKKW